MSFRTEVANAEGNLIWYDEFVRKLLKPQSEQEMQLHVALGICGEAGEYADAIKKQFIYGKERDAWNLREELGDLMFYIQAACNLNGFDMEEIIAQNVAKLRQRYKELQYTDAAAQARADKKKENEYGRS